MRDFADKIKDELKKELEAKVADLKKANEGSDVESIKKATQELSLAAQKVGSEIYHKRTSRRERKSRARRA